MSTGIPSERFECDIYFPRRVPNREWIIDVCHILWQHGMKWSTPHMQVGAWEEQLHAVPSIPVYSRGSLLAQIDEVVKQGFGSLTCYDREVEFHLYIDTDLRMAKTFFNLSSEQTVMLEQLKLGKLELYVRRPMIDAEQRLLTLPVDQAPDAAYMVPPYQQVHIAMNHWVEVLCQRLQPAFAAGYYVTNSFFARENDFLRGFDIATITALEQNRFPPLTDWLTSVYLLYAPASLLESPQAAEWFSSPAMWTRQLPDGGRIAYAMPETLDEIRVRDFNTACSNILRQRDRAQLPLARVYLQRAQEILSVTQQVNYTTNRLLEQLEYMEQHPDMLR